MSGRERIWLSVVPPKTTRRQNNKKAKQQEGKTTRRQNNKKAETPPMTTRAQEYRHLAGRVRDRARQENVNLAAEWEQLRNETASYNSIDDMLDEAIRRRFAETISALITAKPTYDPDPVWNLLNRTGPNVFT
jgi:hypothetical protein